MVLDIFQHMIKFNGSVFTGNVYQEDYILGSGIIKSMIDSGVLYEICYFPFLQIN